VDYLALTLPQILAEADAIARDAQQLFGGLSAAQLNWKPAPDKWSVAQCLDHLMHANQEMHGPLDTVINGTKRTRLLERVPGWARLGGRVMINSVAPQGTRKLQAPRPARPAASTIAPDIVQRFVTNQRATIERMRSLEGRDPARIVVTSPFLALIVYSALDACRTIVAHERRHFAQAQRVMAAPGFPNLGV
jgi:hypothetical protein